MLQLVGHHEDLIFLPLWIITSQLSHLPPLKYAQCRINLCLLQLFLTKTPPTRQERQKCDGELNSAVGVMDALVRTVKANAYSRRTYRTT